MPFRQSDPQKFWATNIPIFFLPTVRQSEKIDNLGDRKYILYTAKGPLVGQMVKLFCLLFAFRLSKPEYLVKP